MKESAVEKLLVTEAGVLGGLTYKFTSPARKGVPDRIVIWPGGVIHFVELKKKGGKLSPLQEREILRLEKQGCRVYILEGEDDVKRYIETIIRGLNCEN